MERLTLPRVCELASGEDIREIKVLNASRKNIKHVDDISPCVELERLNLSHNLIISVDGFKYCTTLTWLDISYNQLESLSGVQSLVNLTVFNASHNKINVVGDISSLKALKALILNNNSISSITGLSALTKLNTLVLSHNLLEVISLDNLSLLTKLSLSNNLLRNFPDTKGSPKLKELRLNNNKIFADLPNALINNQCLEILDIGNNLFSTWNSCHVLHQLTALRNLNISGNKFSTGQFYREVLDDLPSLNILNGKKRSRYEDHVIEQVVTIELTSDEERRQSDTKTLLATAVNNDTSIIKSTSKVKRVKLKEQGDDLPMKRLKQNEDTDSERFSIAAITGDTLQPTNKKKKKVKSVSGVVSVTKAKVKSSNKDRDISELNNNVTFGTGKTTQWF